MKVRFQFSKTGSMRFIGHLDLMRYFQKAFRRAQIPVSYSKGYAPHQIMSFAQPLGIGLSSDAEYLDVTFEDGVDTDHILERINAQMSEEICVKRFTVLDENEKSAMAVLAACDYCVALKGKKSSFLADSKKRREAIARLNEKSEVLAVKKTKHSESLMDIKKNIYCLTDDADTFTAFTGLPAEKTALDPACTVLFFCELTAGSVVNINPTLVLTALCKQEGEPFDEFSYQIHRMQMYADVGAKKGQVRLKSEKEPCQLQPLYMGGDGEKADM